MSLVDAHGGALLWRTSIAFYFPRSWRPSPWHAVLDLRSNTCLSRSLKVKALPFVPPRCTEDVNTSCRLMVTVVFFRVCLPHLFTADKAGKAVSGGIIRGSRGGGQRGICPRPREACAIDQILLLVCEACLCSNPRLDVFRDKMFHTSRIRF